MQEHRSIEQLENNFWKKIEYPSGLVEKCFAYRKIPVSELTVEQLRLLIGQNIGLPFIIPLAVSILQQDILAEGDYYPGDLLSALLELKDEDWYQSPGERTRLINIIDQFLPVIESGGKKILIGKARTFLSSRNGSTQT